MAEADHEFLNGERSFSTASELLVDAVAAGIGFIDPTVCESRSEESGEPAEENGEQVKESGTFLPPHETDGPTPEVGSGDRTWLDGWRFIVKQFVIKGQQFQTNSGFVLHPAGFTGLMFCAYSFRMFFVPLWTLDYIPIVCPIYGEGRHWLAAPYFQSILAHVATGIVCLTLCVFQFNSQVRRRFPVMHRWNGRIYALGGVLCMISLQPLKDVVGQGTSSAPSPYMQHFITACQVLWTVFTARGVAAARAKEFKVHRNWMIRSAAVLTVPISQVGRVGSRTVRLVLVVNSFIF
jgi:hypothetical protein